MAHPTQADQALGREAVRMLYFECRGARYYAGQEGGTSRHPVASSPVEAIVNLIE